jgi:hypothetical protein
VRGGGSPGGRGKKERVLEGKEDRSMLHIYCRQHNETHQTLFEGGGRAKKYNRGSELIQSTLYIPMELSPGNPFVLFTYANKNSKKMLIFFCMISLL